MSRRRGAASMAGSPVLVGALTVLVVIVAVFLSYNANKGLPFVPTYDLGANLPNAAQLVAGNEVRIGGFRVGVVDTITPKRRPDGSTFAVIHMKLQTDVKPLPVDSKLIVRSRSALGLKYVEITPGSSSRGFEAGDTIPLRNATPEPVEIDQVLNTFNLPTRIGTRRSLPGFGNGLAGRGQDLNEAIALLPPLLTTLRPVALNLADPRTKLVRFFPALERAARLVAPVARVQAALFENLDTTFTALSEVARPFIQDTITQSPPTLEQATRDLPIQRAFLANATALSADLRPGVRVLPSTLPTLADALEFGQVTLARTPALNARLARTFLALQRFRGTPCVPLGIDRLPATVVSLKPPLKFLTPAQTTCNPAPLWFRNVPSVLSEGDANGSWRRC